MSKLEPPRTVWVMVPAGPTEQTVFALADLFDEGDTVVDGGNTNWHDDVRRAAALSSAASTTSTSARLAACGGSRSATA